MFKINLPPVVKNILIINIILFIGNWILQNKNNDIGYWLALFSVKSDYFRPYQLVSHMFMHGGVGHIFFNMFGLVMFGRIIENIWGSKKMFVLFFIAGLGAALLHLFINYIQMNNLLALVADFNLNHTYSSYEKIVNKFLLFGNQNFEMMAQSVREKLFYNPDNLSVIEDAKSIVSDIVKFNLSIPTIGASGAVFGLLAAFAMLFPNVELMLIFLPVPIKAKYFIPIYAVIELFLGVANFKGDNIAHFAHLGGAIFGFFIAWYWKKNQFKIY